PTPYKTSPDSFGQYRIYLAKPQIIPDSLCDLDDLSDIPHAARRDSTVPRTPKSDLLAPCPNISAFKLQYWHWNGGVQKSEQSREALVKDVICHPDFVPSDVSGVRWGNLDDALASYSSPSTGIVHAILQLPVPPRTPANAVLYQSKPGLNSIPVPVHQCLSLLQAVQTAFSKNDPRFFHYEPYESHCCGPGGSEDYRTYGEVYESPRMLQMHREVQDIILDEPCKLPRCVAAIMAFSDATQLADFGNAKAWPIRVSFGNLSKYERCKPELKNHFELGFMPSNAFSHRLRCLGFNIFECLTVDFLHEFELGVWKSVFQHILRILEHINSKTVAMFNERFRLVPSFGNGTIRPFSQDVSDMTRPAARNYEDILQCIIPVVEGLLPHSIEGRILTLLYVLAQWHGLAKLRRHTSVSLTALRHTTTRLGHELREFQSYTSELEVYETAKEHAARQQRARKKARPRAALDRNSEAADLDEPAPDIGRRRKYFTLDTIKFHVLGDHPDSVESVGTSDSISTQTGELLHRHDKRNYTRTNGRDYLSQMGKIQRITSRLSDINDGINASESPPTNTNKSPLSDATKDSESLPVDDSGRSPYQIALSQKNPILVPIGLDKSGTDPAVKDFVPRLKAHLLARILGDRYEDEQPRAEHELARVHFQHDRIYSHQTFKIHYTTYDARRAQDTINPSTQKRFVMVPSNSYGIGGIGAHWFWYARVIGIYHANVSYSGSRSRRMDFLWVRWLCRMTDVEGGWDQCQLDQVGYFSDSEESHAFDFVDPADVIRAVHLIPRFAGGQTVSYLESTDSQAADIRKTGNRFADRDMLMRFSGMAIGHMTHSVSPVTTAGVPSESLTAGYEYNEAEDLSSTAVEDDEANGMDEGMDEGNDDSGSDENSTEAGDSDGAAEDCEDEDVSW
ncbi:hypothetical protein FRC07_008220, partial [Ceratobasidium sp. 392]